MKDAALIMRTFSCVLLAVSMSGCALVSGALGQSGAMRVIYYAPAWGPNTNNEEVVYFLKQVTFESGREQQNRIYLCSIKPDGSERGEIAELWAETRDQWLESYATAAHMEINATTKRAAIGVEQGRKSGVFIVDLDGKNFRSLWPKEWNEDRPSKAGYPTWSPDGEWLAFHEYRFEKGFNYYRIAKMRSDVTDYMPLTERNAVNKQPAWSPSGELIAYVSDQIVNPQRNIHAVNLWLMKPDGSEKRDTKVWGRYPRWSPEGNALLVESHNLVDPVAGKRVKSAQKFPRMYSKWGAKGFVAVTPGGIDFTPPDGIETRSLLPNTSRRGTGIEKEEIRW